MASELEVGKLKVAASDGAGGLVHENASGIKVGTDTNTTIGFIGTISDHPLKLMANNSGQVTIDTDGDVTFAGTVVTPRLGIESSSGSYKLYNNSNTYLNGTTTLNGAVTCNNGINVSGGNISLPTAGQTIKSDFSSGGTTRTSTIEMFNNSTGALSLKTVNSATGGIELWTEGAKRLDVTRGGVCTFSNGIALQTAPSNDSATAGEAYTLDKYETGTWTPAATGGGPIAGTSITYTGTYTRIGNLVTVWFTITASAQDLVIAGSPPFVGLAGLPFTVASSGTGWYSTEDVDAERGGEMKAAGTVLYLGPGGSGSATNSIAGSVTYRV